LASRRFPHEGSDRAHSRRHRLGHLGAGRDRVADNLDFHEMTESETLVFGTDFGIVTDIETGPGGNLFVVSLDQGAIYEIARR
jgi:hypothetical protein